MSCAFAYAGVHKSSVALQGHGHRVTRVTATDDGIYSASFDSSLRYWSFDELHEPCAQPAAAGRQQQQSQ